MRKGTFLFWFAASAWVAPSQAALLFDAAVFNQIGSFNTVATASQLTQLQQAYVADGLRTISVSSRLTPLQQRGTVAAAFGLEALNFAQNVKTVYQVSEAESVRGIVSALSAFDTSEQQAALADYRREVRNAAADYNVTAEVPTIAVYPGVVVDPGVRATARSSLTSVNTTLAEQRRVAESLATQIATLDQVSSRAGGAAVQASGRAESLLQLIAELGPTLNPATNFFIASANSASAALIGSSLDFDALANDASNIASEARALQTRVQAGIAQLETVASTYQSALSTPLAQSRYNFTGNFPGYGSTINTAGYTIGFGGRSFTEDGAVLPASFEVGSLSFFNGSGAVGTDRYGLDITLAREITVPGVGNFSASTTSTLGLSYETTPFDENPRVSADRIFISEIGKGAAVFEGELAFFDIIGSVNSPLRFIDLQVAPGSESVAFVTNAPLATPIPEPGALGFFGVGALLLAARRLVGRSRAGRS